MCTVSRILYTCIERHIRIYTCIGIRMYMNVYSVRVGSMRLGQKDGSAQSGGRIRLFAPVSWTLLWHQRRSAAAGSVGGKRSEGAGGAASTAAPGVQGGCQGAPISPRCTLLSRPAARACGRGLQQRVVGAAGRLLRAATTGRCACAAGHGRCSRRRHRWGYIPVSLSWRTGSRAFARREREEPCAKHAQRRRNRRRRINACGQARNSQQHQSN